MSKMDNNKKVCKAHTCYHQQGVYSITLNFPDRFISMSANCYEHHPGSHTEVNIFELSPEDMLQIADAIRKVALDLKPELNESLTIGAGI